MYYIDSIKPNGLIGIANSDSGVLEFHSIEEIKQYQRCGIQILPFEQYWNGITQKELNKSNKMLLNYLYRHDYEPEIIGFLNSTSILLISKVLNELNTSLDLKRLCKCLQYKEQFGYIILVLGLVNDGMLFVKADFNNATVDTFLVRDEYKLGYYSSCSGWNIMHNLLKDDDIKVDGIEEDEVYTTLYSKDDKYIVLVNHFDFSILKIQL